MPFQVDEGAAHSWDSIETGSAVGHPPKPQTLTTMTDPNKNKGFNHYCVT